MRQGRQQHHPPHQQGRFLESGPRHHDYDVIAGAMVGDGLWELPTQSEAGGVDAGHRHRVGVVLEYAIEHGGTVLLTRAHDERAFHPTLLRLLLIGAEPPAEPPAEPRAGTTSHTPANQEGGARTEGLASQSASSAFSGEYVRMENGTLVPIHPAFRLVLVASAQGVVSRLSGAMQGLLCVVNFYVPAEGLEDMLLDLAVAIQCPALHRRRLVLLQAAANDRASAARLVDDLLLRLSEVGRASPCRASCRASCSASCSEPCSASCSAPCSETSSPPREGSEGGGEEIEGRTRVEGDGRREMLSCPVRKFVVYWNTVQYSTVQYSTDAVVSGSEVCRLLVAVPSVLRV